MPFSAIENQATLDAAQAERRRREELLRVQREEEQLAQDAAEQKAAAKTGPAGVLAALMSRGRPTVSGDVLKNAEEDQFLNEQATRRFGRRADTLGDEKARLAVPPLSPAERYSALAKPLGRFATEEPTREDLPELRQLRAGMNAPPVSRETADRIYYREEPSGTLSFTNRPEVAAGPGYRRYNADSGATKDLGAPGGSLSMLGGGEPDRTPQRALLQDLDATIGKLDRSKLTPQEAAQDLITQQPGWDKMAAESSPGDVADNLLQALGTGRLRPETAQALHGRYAGYARQATDRTTGEFDPQLWREFLQQGRTPAPGEAEALAKTGGHQVPEAATAEQAAVQDALQPAKDAPGSTQSPALAAESMPASPTPQATPGAMASQRRPMEAGPGVGSLDELLASIYGPGSGPSPQAAVGARQRDALLRSLGR